MIVCQKGGSISREYKLPPKKTIGVINNVGIIDICSKLELINPIKKPNNAKVNATKINKKIINKGYITFTSTKKVEVMNITIELVRRGYSEEEIEKIWSKNLMRVFREVQAVAESMQIETQS